MSSLKLKSYPTVPVDGYGVDNSKPEPIIELRKEGCRAEGLFYRLGFAGKLYCSFGFLPLARTWLFAFMNALLKKRLENLLCLIAHLPHATGYRQCG